MKNFISGIVVMCMVICMLPVVSYAETFLCDGFKYEVVDDNAVITGRSGSLFGDIVIPSILDGYDVIGIGKKAFTLNENITSVVISEGIEYIDEEAFKDSRALKIIVLPNSLRTINKSAFSSCISLESINLHDGITYIGESAFNDCRALKNITIPREINEIGIGWFQGCLSLESFVIPEHVVSVGGGAFSRSKIKEIIFPDSVTTVGNRVFEYCKNLETVILPNKVIKIPEYFFSSCTNLRTIYIPKSVTKIEYGVFKGCTNITDIYYEGSERDWLNIDIVGDMWHSSELLFNATFHYNTKKNYLIGEKEITVNVNGQEIYFDVPPIIENGRTLVPVRAIFEAMGMEVMWDNNTRTVIANGNGNELILPIGNYIATVNGKECVLDVPAKILDGRTLVPVRFIAESVGATVVWNNENRKVLITY